MFPVPLKIFGHASFFRKRGNTLAGWGFLLFAVMIFPLRAEVIVFSDQSFLEGVLLEEKKNFIVLESEGEKYVIRRNLIDKILNDVEGKNFIKQKEIQKKQDEAKKKSEQKRQKVQEQAERELKKAASETKDTASMVKNFSYSPRWMMLRSAVLPGWGQYGSGMPSGAALITGTAAGGAVLVYFNDLARKELKKYKNQVLFNTLLTMVPGPYTTEERLGAGYVMNDRLGGPCGPQQINFNYAKISFGAFYAAQLAHLGWSIGKTSLLADKSEHYRPIIFSFYTFPSLEFPGKMDSGIFIQYRF